MRGVLLIFLICSSGATFADVPRCWQADQPNQNIQDGLFRIFIPTANTGAITVAQTVAVVLQSLTSQKGIGTSFTLDQIEIDVYGDLSHWIETAAYPTLDAFKTAIVTSLAPVLSLPGVSVTCAVNSPRHPVP